MMFSINFIITTFITYMGLLFLIAYFVDNKNFLSSDRLKPYIYSLSFAIYCTAWTYYGSVGKAVSSGFLFLTVYLGPTLIMFLWPIILRKMIRIKNIFKITSLADLITVRYEKSALIGAFVSLGALFGTIPYISIQLKALITSISILEDRSVELSYTQNLISQNVGILIVILMVFFTILFGIRKLDPTERHEGMMVIVAIESLVKLFAIMIIGFFVVFFVMDGIPDILAQAEKQNFFNSIAIEKGGDGYANWTSVLMLSMFAIMFLPRQFHVSVVENSSEKHISTVMWLLPAYLLLITFFTIPIAMGGSLLNPDTDLIDFYVLMIPYEQNAPYLSMVAFIGGFSASTSMIMVTSMTMSIMISNYLLLPIIEFYKPLAFLKKRILFLRWIVVALFISMGYIFYVAISKDNLIVNIGLISFTAILQFVPTIIGGLFWKESSKSGALWGMSLGFIMWFYLLIVPQFVQIGLIDSAVLSEGLFGIWLLKPTAFLGLTDFASIPHAVFWSMFFNITAFVLCSLLAKKSNEDIELAGRFVDVLTMQKTYEFKDDLHKSINVKQKCHLFEEVLNSYFPAQKTKVLIDKICNIHVKENQELISIVEYSKLYSAIEKELTGSIGSASAHRALVGLFTKDESKELSNIYADMLTKMNITPEQFNEKIDYFKEKEKLLEKHSKELTQKVEDRTKDLLEQKNVFETLFKEASYGISLIKNGRFIDCNDTVLKMLKLENKEEFLKLKPYELSPEYQLDGELSKTKEKYLINECMQNGQIEFEWLHVRSNGETFLAEITLTKILLNQEDIIHVIWRDITEKKMLEEKLIESEKIASLGNLVAGVAHELNTPIGIGLTGITHFLDMSKQIKKDYEEENVSQEEFERFLKDSNEIATLINLNLAKTAQLIRSFKQISVDQVSEEKRVFNVKKYIEEILLSLKNITKKIDLYIEINCDDDIEILSYPGAFSQVLTNLVINSIRHGFDKTRVGTIFIDITKDENTLKMTYKDTGTGIPKENLLKVFDPFFTTKRGAGGTGLGLNIIYNIVTSQLGGTITCKSEKDDGTEFTVTMNLNHS